MRISLRIQRRREAGAEVEQLSGDSFGGFIPGRDQLDEVGGHEVFEKDQFALRLELLDLSFTWTVEDLFERALLLAKDFGHVAVTLLAAQPSRATQQVLM